MAHRLSRTARTRAIRQADVRVGKYRGGTMDMATLRPKPRGPTIKVTQHVQRARSQAWITADVGQKWCWNAETKLYYECG